MPTHKPQMRRPTQSMAMFWDAVIKTEPKIHKRHANWSAAFREYLSAIKDEASEPKRLPAGMDAVMPPCVYETGFPKYRL